MPENLATALNALIRHRRALARAERQLLPQVNRALARAGYRIEPLIAVASIGAGDKRERQRASTKRKRFRCPHCARRFAHPLPMARHVTATQQRPAARSTRKAAGAESRHRTARRRRRRARAT